MSIIQCSLLTATSGTAYVYSDPIDLTKRHLADRNVSVKCDISGSAVSGIVGLNACWTESSGGTYAFFATGQGATTKILSSGTSVGGYGTNGSYLIPLYFSGVGLSGVTDRFKTGGFLKIGAIANNNNSPVNINIIVH